MLAWRLVRAGYYWGGDCKRELLLDIKDMTAATPANITPKALVTAASRRDLAALAVHIMDPLSGRILWKHQDVSPLGPASDYLLVSFEQLTLRVVKSQGCYLSALADIAQQAFKAARAPPLHETAVAFVQQAIASQAATLWRQGGDGRFALSEEIVDIVHKVITSVGVSIPPGVIVDIVQQTIRAARTLPPYAVVVDVVMQAFKAAEAPPPILEVIEDIVQQATKADMVRQAIKRKAEAAQEASKAAALLEAAEGKSLAAVPAAAPHSGGTLRLDQPSSSNSSGARSSTSPQGSNRDGSSCGEDSRQQQRPPSRPRLMPLVVPDGTAVVPVATPKVKAGTFAAFSPVARPARSAKSAFMRLQETDGVQASGESRGVMASAISRTLAAAHWHSVPLTEVKFWQPAVCYGLNGTLVTKPNAAYAPNADNQMHVPEPGMIITGIRSMYFDLFMYACKKSCADWFEIVLGAVMNSVPGTNIGLAT